LEFSTSLARLKLKHAAGMIESSDIRKNQRHRHVSRRRTAMRPVSPSRLRRFPTRISLRTLMLLVLVVGGGLGWYSLQRQREARRQWVIDTIQASHPSIDFDGQGISRILWFGGAANASAFAQNELKADQIDALGACDRLRDLMMVSSVMTDPGLAKLADDHLLERLYCWQPRITDAGVKHLARLRRLKKLELLRAPDLTDASLKHLAGLSDLEEINLAGARITGSGFVDLAGLRQLTALVVPNAALDDAGLANLGRLTQLRQLYVGGGAYTDAGLASLSNLTGLTELGIGSEACTDAGLAQLVRLANLRKLQITGPRITDAWLDRIAAMKSLRQVLIDGGQVSDEAIERLHRALPEAQIFVDGRPK
jgi:hypothetical protein